CTALGKERDDLHQQREAWEGTQEALLGQRAEQDRRIEELGAQIEGLTQERDEIAAAKEAIEAEMEILRRRRVTLQAELNDAHHELYDVRKALVSRVE